jgi:hypothetical protein
MAATPKTPLELVIESHAYCAASATELQVQLSRFAELRRRQSELQAGLTHLKAAALAEVNEQPNAPKTESGREAAAAVILDGMDLYITNQFEYRTTERDARQCEASAEAIRERLSVERVYMAALGRLAAVNAAE